MNNKRFRSFKTIVSFNCSAAWVLAGKINSRQVYKQQTYNPWTGHYHLGKMTARTRIGPFHWIVCLCDRVAVLEVKVTTSAYSLRAVKFPTRLSCCVFFFDMSVANRVPCPVPPPIGEQPNYHVALSIAHKKWCDLKKRWMTAPGDDCGLHDKDT